MAMARASALAALLAVLALAGCVQPPEPVAPATLPPPVPDLGLGQVLEALAPLSDGLRAHGTIYLPDVPEGTKVPVVMDLGPYYGNLNGETSAYNETFPPNMLYNDLLKRGYAIALMSVRGTGQSEGCFAIGGELEQQDAADIVEWLASQDWSDGNVAMTGVSYDGTTPWEAAVKAPPHLKAIVPVEGISDMYRYTFFGGVPVSNGPSFQTYYTALVDWGYLDTDHAAAWGAAQPTNLCPEQVARFGDSWDTWLDGVHDAYWDERDTTAHLDQIKAATFVVHGFQDWNVRTDEVQWEWEKLPAPKRMLLGQWEHNIPWRNSFNEDWSLPAYNATIAQWFDAFVRGDAEARAAALAAPPVVAQDSQGTWWNLTAWPPAEARLAPLYLTTNRTLSAAVGSEHDEVAFRGSISRDDFAGTFGVWNMARSQLEDTVPGPGPQVAFASPTLASPVHLMGNPAFHATVSADQPGGYLGAILYDEGPLRTMTRVTPGYVNLATRDDVHRAQDVPTGTPLDLTIRLYALNHVFEAGHRLVIVLDAEPTEWASASHPGTTYTLQLSPDSPAWLDAPVFAGTLPVDVEPPTTAGPRSG
jgi:X-Pro dipeptidyl-peptidase